MAPLSSMAVIMVVDEHVVFREQAYWPNKGFGRSILSISMSFAASGEHVRLVRLGTLCMQPVLYS
jgi:hypothetical protein